MLLLATSLAYGQRGVAAGRGGFVPHGNFGFHVNTGVPNIRTGFPHTGYNGHYGYGYSPYLYGYVNQPYPYRPYYGYPGYPYYPYYSNYRRGYPYRHYPYYPYGGYYGGYGYGYYLGDYSGFSYDDSGAYQQQSAETQQLSNQVNQLTYEVQRLREQQAEAYAAPPPPAPAAPQAPEPPPAAIPGSHGKSQAKPVTMTKLVFRDGHTEEVADYAIVGQTLWIFSEQRAMKVPMEKINVSATQRANEERGLDFVVP